MTRFAKSLRLEPWSSGLAGDFEPATDNPKARQLLDLVRGGDLMLAISELNDFVRRCVLSRQLHEFEAVLRALTPHVGESLEFSIAVLTASLPVKRGLKNRTTFFDAVSHELLKQDLEPAQVLRGLQ
jgi:hypothetical protein